MEYEENELTRIVIKQLIQKRLNYLLSPKENNIIVVSLIKDNKRMDMHLFIYENKINMQLHLPFTTEQYMSPLISLYKNEYNRGKAFSMLHHTQGNGRIYYEYSYMVAPDAFNEDYFWIYWESLVQEANNNYTRLSHLATGLMNENQKQQYIELLQKQIEKLQRSGVEDSVSYGDTSAPL